MSKTLKHIYTKLNENTVINFWSADILTLIDTYFDAGKITQKPVKAVDGLKEHTQQFLKTKLLLMNF